MALVEWAFAFALTVAAAGALWLVVWMLLASRRKEVYVAPFNVAGDGADPGLGSALAAMLRARLVQAQREADLRSILAGAGDADAAAALAAPLVAATADRVRDAVEPANVDFSIGKVSVGGLLSWAQRWALARQTLRLNVVLANGTATVSGTLEPFPVTRVRDLWSTTAADPVSIVEGAADAILRSLAAESDREGTQAATALDSQEFGDLLWSLNQLALHERRRRFGQSTARGTATLEAVRERLGLLSETFPDWAELTRLADDLDRRLAFERAPARGLPQEPVEDVDGPSFLDDVRAILRRYFPDDDPPEIVFGEDMMAGLQAMWNGDENRLEVNPGHVGDVGAGPIALIARFMSKNWDRCHDTIKDTGLWNDYRNGVVEYLVATDPELDSSPANEWLRAGVFYGWLQELGTREGIPPEAPRRLALQMLDHYACGWTWGTVGRGVLSLNRKAEEPVPVEPLRAAVRTLRPARAA